MAKILTFEIPENEYNDLNIFLKECSAEIRKSLETMKQDQTEIDQLDKDIRQIRANTEKSKETGDKILTELLAKHSIFA